MQHADIVIIGAGAAAAAFAWRTSGRGMRVVCLEQGDWLNPAKSPGQAHDWELALQSHFHPNPNVRGAPADYPVDDSDSPISPANFNAVGGSTVRWGAHFPRMHPSDFRVRSLDGVGADWPLTYADLAPYYAINDTMMGVCGLAGDPANPPRCARTSPPLPLCPATRALAQGFDALNWHWWPSDAAIATTPSKDRAACNYCGPCGVGCARKSRASVDLTYWPAALQAGVILHTQCTATAIHANAAGTRATCVSYTDNAGREHRVAAETVVVAASGLGTPRLLLASIQRGQSLGSINASNLIGRNLMLHPTAIATGLFGQSLPSRGPFACALYSQQFYETDLTRGFARGFQLQALRGQGPLTTALGGYMKPLAWGRNHHREFADQYERSVSLTITTDDLPERHNRVSLHPARRDKHGLPVPRMHYRVGSNTQAILNFGISQAQRVLRAAGAQYTRVNPLSRQAGFHFLGTARMGHNPADSVVDRNGRCHEMSNLLIIDGSVFASAGAVNPTPTIQAIALRCADALCSDPLAPDPAG